MRIISLAILLTLITGTVWAHSGGLDPFGCHTDSSTGVKHCHLPDIAPAPIEGLIRREYKGFVLYLDCQLRGVVHFRYEAVPDNDLNLKRPTSYRMDTEVPRECQQYSTHSYGADYERGHMVPANHMDHDPTSIYDTNYMTNILPQYRTLNRGAWYRTEKIVECARDHLIDLQVHGGAIWSNAKNDLFMDSHGVPTPDRYWKVVWGQTSSGATVVNAWIIPNDGTADRRSLELFEVSVSQVEAETSLHIPLPMKLKYTVYRTWGLTDGCQLN